MTDYVTPHGIAVWPKLNTPDFKWNPDGEYTVKLKISAEESQPLIKQLEELRDTYLATAIKEDPKVAKYQMAPLYEEEADDQDNLTGFNIFKFKQKAKITTRKGEVIEKRVAIYDSNKTPTTSTVTGGSTLRVAGSVFGYAMPSSRMVGLSLRPEAVQIITLASAGGGEAAATMFDKEDGFVADSFVNMETAAADDEADF
tara:strand:- start:2027 stop:2626 length:600 start_codon:yes stop_codon:yes gene_type:complete